MTPSTRARTRIAALTAALAVAVPVAVETAPADAARPASGLSKQDRTYLHDAAQANLAEVAAGRLAAHRSGRPAVRAFGREMVVDHGKLYRSLDRLATKVDVTLPQRPSAEQRKVGALLSTSGGKAFTCAYVPFQWDDHQLVIAKTVKEVRQGSDPKVVAAAKASLPVLREHYRMATRLLKRLHSC